MALGGYWGKFPETVKESHLEPLLAIALQKVPNSPLRAILGSTRPLTLCERSGLYHHR